VSRSSYEETPAGGTDEADLASFPTANVRRQLAQA
jgi:hypothetical protein